MISIKSCLRMLETCKAEKMKGKTLTQISQEIGLCTNAIRVRLDMVGVKFSELPSPNVMSDEKIIERTKELREQGKSLKEIVASLKTSEQRHKRIMMEAGIDFKLLPYYRPKLVKSLTIGSKLPALEAYEGWARGYHAENKITDVQLIMIQERLQQLEPRA